MLSALFFCMTPSQRASSAAGRAHARPETAFLASDEASCTTGTTVFVDGGLLWNYEEQ
jgi:enoyl-[acyl-carrier-protein] reductase (NADH)